MLKIKQQSQGRRQDFFQGVSEGIFRISRGVRDPVLCLLCGQNKKNCRARGVQPTSADAPESNAYNALGLQLWSMFTLMGYFFRYQYCCDCEGVALFVR